MTSYKWKLENLIDNSVIYIEKSLYTIGRQIQADLSTTSSRISREHATLYLLSDGQLSVTDHKSTNGTYVNGKKITTTNLLHEDILSFGGVPELVKGPDFDKARFLFKVVKVEDEPKTSIQIVDDSPIKIKEEIPTAYATDNECIIISDGEDDDIQLSQIYQISQKIKEESLNNEDCFNPYQEIKEELEYLDQCTSYPVDVDLTGDSDLFESTNDLLNFLESNTEVDVNNREIETNDSKLKEVEQNEKHAEESVGPESENLDLKLKKLKVVLNQIPKYVKPPIVNPHIQNKKVTIKRKSTDTKNIEITKKKTRKHSTAENSKIDKGECKNQELEKPPETTATLMNDKDNEEVNLEDEGPNYAVVGKLKFSNVKYSFTDQTDIKNKTDSTGIKSKVPPKKSIKKQKNPRCKIVQDTRVTSSIHIQISETLDSSSDDKSGLIWQTLNTNTNNNNHFNKRTLINIENEINNILCWCPEWLLQQKNSDISPPVNSNTLSSPVPPIFNSIEHYVDVMMPLLKLELWQYIYQMTYETDERNIVKVERKIPLKINLEHERKAGPMMYLDCSFNPAKNSLNVMPFKIEDYCMLEIKFKDSDNYYKYTCFGYIKNISYPNRHNANGNLCIITKSCNKQICNKTILIRICANIASNTRLFKTLKSLKNSSLSSYVLNPTFLSNIMPIKGAEVRITPNLNSLQNEVKSQASEMVFRNTPGFYLIKGPPGTGKSTVIVNIILEILYKSLKHGSQPRILLTAPSNTAIDGLVLKLNRARQQLPNRDRKLIKMVRIGPNSSVNELVNNYTLNFQVKNNILLNKKLHSHPSYEKVLKKKLSADQFLREMLGNQYAYEQKVTEDKILEKANLICTTLNSCMSYVLNNPTRLSKMKYTCCIIDESSQCNEIESLSPIQLGINKFILVGDPQQLPAVVCNKEAQQLGFGKSLFSRIADQLSTNDQHKNQYPIKMLTEQYRMVPEICHYPNKTFYNSQLKSCPKFQNAIKPDLKPYMLFNIVNNVHSTTDYINLDEVFIICKLLETLKERINSDCEYSIGIITPYRAQKEMILKHISEIQMKPSVSIVVNTVDSFQGLENDIIIISCVRYSSNCFLANTQRLNVALTRAKQALYVIGNYKLFKECRPLYDLREDAKARKLLLDIKADRKSILSFHQYIFNLRK